MYNITFFFSVIKAISIVLQTIPDFVDLAEGHAVDEEDTREAQSRLIGIEDFDEVWNIVS